MGANKPLRVVLCWHMHQPDYRNYSNGEYQQPWTYLHGIKDYVDMVAHLEHQTEARVVVNFAPILLLQIDDYATQINAYFKRGTPVKDVLLQALVNPVLAASGEQWHVLIKACTKANEQHMVERFEPFKRLVSTARWIKSHPEQGCYFNSQFYIDLLVWYHLAWLGETVRADKPEIKQLLAKQRGFSLHDRRVLLKEIGLLLSTLLKRYRSLSETGQIELSISPFAHPMIPLIIDPEAARETMPDMIAPVMTRYPGGLARSEWHLLAGIKVFKRFFGRQPSGCWLSEGGVSEAALKLLSGHNFNWTASGENVLRHSLAATSKSAELTSRQWLYRSYCLPNLQTRIFFRDDELSDLIGFTYSHWHGDDAVADLIRRLEQIADDPARDNNTVVSLILDGENAWESYPRNGAFFLPALYAGIAKHPRLALTTFSDCVASEARPETLAQVRAGSWVYGTFSTWIGEAQKNRAWDMLAEAKQCYDSVVASELLNDEQLERATYQLAVCESSDWFWWFGDSNPAETVLEFDRLFRMHLANLYLFLQREPPDYLADSFAHGSGHPALGGTMKPGSQS